jgi:MFS family permease
MLSRMNNQTTAPSKWRGLVAAWLGWAFDGLDGYLYIMVAIPFVTKLVAAEHAVTQDAVAASPDLTGEVRWKATIIQAVFLLGWAIGGTVFGRLGDRLGRARTLTLTILMYAIFTGLSFFATRWWHLLIFRFLAALGIGGEWAAGSALVSETLDSKHRAWASATLQSGYILGCIAAALTSGAMKGIDPKWVFVIGVLPAFVTLWIRSAVPEPAEWQSAVKDKEPPHVAALFAPGIARTTCVLLAHLSIALTTVWAFLFFSPQMVATIPEVKNWPKPDVDALKTRVTVAYFVVNIGANYFATYLASLIGYRFAFSFMTLGALVSVMWGYRSQPTLDSIYLVTGLVAFFGLGLFAMFPLYVPPLFPTLLRTLGAGFTYNAGRIAAAAGTLVAGNLSSQAGGPAQAVWYVGLLYIPGLLVCFFLPEPNFRPSKLGIVGGAKSV